MVKKLWIGIQQWVQDDPMLVNTPFLLIKSDQSCQDVLYLFTSYDGANKQYLVHYIVTTNLLIQPHL